VDENITITANRDRIKQMLINLIENGIRFAKARLRITAARLEQYGKPILRLEIEDDGPGMSADQAEQALKRGTRLDETTPGSGLGLSIVRDIVREYNGELQLERSQLGGLLAIVLLPAR
jgi:signal transduction histidine kinase